MTLFMTSSSRGPGRLARVAMEKQANGRNDATTSGKCAFYSLLAFFVTSGSSPVPVANLGVVASFMTISGILFSLEREQPAIWFDWGDVNDVD